MGLEDRKTAEAAKVRLVRCPKCENLLPELPDFPMYQCGGCGAVLEAKKKGSLEDRLSEKTDDVKGSRISEERSLLHISEVEMEKENGTELGMAVRSHSAKTSSNGSSTLQVENGETKSDSEMSRRERERMVMMDSMNHEYGSYGSGLVRDNRDLNASGIENTNFKGEHAVKELEPPMEPLRSRQLPMEEPDMAASVGPVKGVAAQVRFNDYYLYRGEEPSSHRINSYYEFDERARYHDPDIDGRASVKNMENDQAELLRKLDELKDQISRSCDVADRHKERIIPDQITLSSTLSDHYGRYRATYVQEGLTSSHGLDKKPLSSHDLESPYLGHMARFNPYTDRYSSRGRESYPQRGFPHVLLARGDTYHQEILRGRTLQSESQYMNLLYNEQFPGYYVNASHNQIMLHSHKNFLHQPTCSCVHCHNKNSQLPPKVDHLGVHDQRTQNEPSNLNFHGSINPSPQGLQGYNFGGSGLHQLKSRQSSHMNSSDIDSENICSNYHHPRKLAVSCRSGDVCRPIVGGAPFITCFNCFELLKLPRSISSSKMQHKMKCGACSSIISFEVGNNGCIGSVSVQVGQVPNKIDEGSSGTVDENVIYWRGDTNSADLNCDSNDYDDLPAKFSPIGRKSISGESEKQQDPFSTTLCHLKNEQSPENITSGKYDSSYMESPLKEIKSSPNPELLTKERTNRFPDTKVIGQSDDGNRSKRSEPERIAFGGTNFRHNSATEAIVATEMDVSLNKFSNSCVSQDSVETSKEDHRKVNKGGESFFTGLIKKSCRDLTKNIKSVQDGGSPVFVNGHVIHDRVVKKAEKLAGPIQPGEYWYDKCAGFWGVMGHPCLGIIMPNIEEFNYPMPKNCAAGNTGVFVNGRELHQKDLDLLSNRGLPITRQRSYNVEITGKVIDERTGEELDLGKLAPTVERAEHGFGMKVPRYLG